MAGCEKVSCHILPSCQGRGRGITSQAEAGPAGRPSQQGGCAARCADAKGLPVMVTGTDGNLLGRSDPVLGCEDRFVLACPVTCGGAPGTDFQFLPAGKK